MSMIIAAMPAHNEVETIAKGVLGAKKHVDKVVVVDDGSTDSTAKIADALSAMVVRHKENRGYGAAIRTCFETANNFFSKEKTLTKREGANQGCLTKEEAIKSARETHTGFFLNMREEITS